MTQLSRLVQEPVEFSGGGEYEEGDRDPETEGRGNHEGEAIQGIEAGECQSRCINLCTKGGNCQVRVCSREMRGFGAEVSSDGGGLQGERTGKGSIGATVEYIEVRLPGQLGRNQ